MGRERNLLIDARLEDRTPQTHIRSPINAENVRRMTPIEWERLQGFPDNWTLVPYRNKTEDKCPDGPRYKALGNSMAVNVMRWIGKRISSKDQEIRDAKLCGKKDF